ncbi:MAG: Ig-like domain-containing protein, partial [Clostridium sp.]|nr:Ig-like domain-containing protein [Clostridium sp.]
TATWNTNYAGSKILYVNAKDSSGKVVTKTMNYEIKEKSTGLTISSFIADKQSPQVVGTEVALTAKATGSGTLQYRFIVEDERGNYSIIKNYSTSNIAIWNANYVGSKILYVDVKDSAGKVVRKSMNYIVNEKNQEVEEEKVPKVIYEGNIQTYGWMNKVSDGEICGIIGKSLRLEGYKLSLDTTEDLSIEYRSHVQDMGWQDYVKDGELSGTENKSRRLEAISIKLSGSAANKYDVYYRVHCSYIGWLDWAKNGEDAGSTGQGIKVEAMQVVVLPKGQKAPGSTKNHFLSTPSVSYTVKLNNENYGTSVKDGAIAGTTGQSKQIEGIKINLDNMSMMSGSINYQGHIQNVGWGDTVSNGTTLGVYGNRLEAIKIWLSGSISIYYDVYYRVHCQNLGWLDWAKNGEKAGSEGYSYRAEAIEIKLYRKDFGPETIQFNSFKKKTKNPLISHLDSPKKYSSYKDNLVISGWALSDSGIKQMDVYIDDKFYKGIDTGILRDDVYKVYPDYDDKNSGYSLTIPMSELGLGYHDVKVYAISYDDKVTCDESYFYNNMNKNWRGTYNYDSLEDWRKTILERAFSLRGLVYDFGGNYDNINKPTNFWYNGPASNHFVNADDPNIPWDIKSAYVNGWGFDCAGFAEFCYMKKVNRIGHTTWDIVGSGRFKQISASKAKPGDLFFIKSLGHVGIFLRTLDNDYFEFIDCNQTWENDEIGAKRGRVEVRRGRKIEDCLFYTLK